MSAPARHVRTLLLALCVVVAAAAVWWSLADDAPAPAPEAPGDGAAQPAPTPAVEGPALAAPEAAPNQAPTPAPQREARAPAPAEDRVHVTGRVVGPDRRPVAGAQVTVLAIGQRFAAVTSGRDGTFRAPAARPSGATGMQASVAARDGAGRVGLASVVLYAAMP